MVKVIWEIRCNDGKPIYTDDYNELMKFIGDQIHNSHKIIIQEGYFNDTGSFVYY